MKKAQLFKCEKLCFLSLEKKNLQITLKKLLIPWQSMLLPLHLSLGMAQLASITLPKKFHTYICASLWL